MHGVRLLLKGPIKGEVIADDGNGDGIILVIEAFLLASLHEGLSGEVARRATAPQPVLLPHGEGQEGLKEGPSARGRHPSPRRRRKKSPSRKKPKAMAETAHADLYRCPQGAGAWARNTRREISAGSVPKGKLYSLEEPGVEVRDRGREHLEAFGYETGEMEL